MTGWRKRAIMEMARETKLPYDFVTGEPLYAEKLEAFAAIVREDEREACAKTVENIETYENVEKACFKFAARQIRARGQA